MTNFETYYTTKFRQHITLFFSTIPDQSKFHEDNQTRQTFSIQYERLTGDFGHLNQLTKNDREYFGVALFFTVLIDMVCYSNFREYYDKFRQLTLYPKFIGNCPRGCYCHYHPSDIFFAMNEGLSAQELHLIFSDKFIEATETMRKETLNFFKKHLTEIDGENFWNKCIKEFPYRTDKI